MAENAPTQESQSQAAERISKILETKEYIDNPEILPWYRKELNEIKPRTRELLETYSKIPSGDVEAHVHKVRDDAFKIFPYPCLGNWGFLNLNIADSPVYSEVLERVKNGEQYLDIGCCMGQDVRKLISDGAPPENVFASDVKKEFWDIGQDLFLDKDSLNVKFISADALDPDSDLKELDGKLNLVLAHSFFHLFSWDDQVKAAKRVVQLLKPEPGAMVFGRQGAKPDAGSFAKINKVHTAFWHNVESWEKLWKQVGEETGTQWDVKSSLGEEDLSDRLRMSSLVPSGTRYMTFTIRRL
ncbi:hypothetical protein FB567DRAFT_614085 [Paraphoma chrysanthemicola]|uniref:Methyltransferase domain-containing protein n=1 Tax=Paraphoma chrysanthemicola TaxID=798071 RepID=A0A8K0W1U8_9PLEO|nr:hypothetical protein FB567DRAFT_614085 [Paraphoma chrysanthemicola]